MSDPTNPNIGLKEKNIVEFASEEMKGTSEKASEELIYSFSESDTIIFDVNTNPERDSSSFVNHKYQVIKNSIQYNLNLAMSIYNAGTSKSYQFNMPAISNDEWNQIIENVSIVSFLQGLQCGMKTYNNYAIVSSTNNELTVLADEIYFTNESKLNAINAASEADVATMDPPVYHRIDCPRLGEEIKDWNTASPALSEAEKKLTSFKSKEVKYDKVYEKTLGKYLYDHRTLACYTCIIDGNYTPDNLDLPENEERKKSYYIAIGKERYNIYKTNAIKFSEGYEIIYDNGHGVSNEINKESSRGMDEIKKIEITFGIIISDDFSINTAKFNMTSSLFTTEMNSVDYVLNTNQNKEQTLVIDVHVDHNNKIEYADIAMANIDPVALNEDPYVDQIRKTIKSIKVIYE